MLVEFFAAGEVSLLDSADGVGIAAVVAGMAWTIDMEAHSMPSEHNMALIISVFFDKQPIDF